MIFSSSALSMTSIKRQTVNRPDHLEDVVLQVVRSLPSRCRGIGDREQRVGGLGQFLDFTHDGHVAGKVKQYCVCHCRFVLHEFLSRTWIFSPPREITSPCARACSSFGWQALAVDKGAIGRLEIRKQDIVHAASNDGVQPGNAMSVGLVRGQVDIRHDRLALGHASEREFVAIRQRQHLAAVQQVQRDPVVAGGGGTGRRRRAGQAAAAAGWSASIFCVVSVCVFSSMVPHSAQNAAPVMLS